eukprot:1109100-Rhodomonas_salina.1
MHSTIPYLGTAQRIPNAYQHTHLSTANAYQHNLSQYRAPHIARRKSTTFTPHHEEEGEEGRRIEGDEVRSGGGQVERDMCCVCRESHRGKPIDDELRSGTLLGTGEGAHRSLSTSFLRGESLLFFFPPSRSCQGPATT